MMQGFVNQNCEAIIRIAIETVIDTGFTGFVSLPSSVIESLRLPWIFRDGGTLGDGSEVTFDMYHATIIWDGQLQVVDVFKISFNGYQAIADSPKSPLFCCGFKTDKFANS
jgi:predicted aspartyl protease